MLKYPKEDEEVSKYPALGLLLNVVYVLGLISLQAGLLCIVASVSFFLAMSSGEFGSYPGFLILIGAGLLVSSAVLFGSTDVFRMLVDLEASTSEAAAYLRRGYEFSRTTD